VQQVINFQLIVAAIGNQYNHSQVEQSFRPWLQPPISIDQLGMTGEWKKNYHWQSVQFK
jgi:hypothetical protein